MPPEGVEQNLETALASLKSIIKQQHKTLNVLLTNVEHLKTTKDKTKSPTVIKAMDEVIGASEALKTITKSVHSAYYEAEKAAIRVKYTDQHTTSRTIQETILKVCEDLKDRLDKQQEDINDLKSYQASPATSYASKARTPNMIPPIVADPTAGQLTPEQSAQAWTKVTRAKTKYNATNVQRSEEKKTKEKKKNTSFPDAITVKPGVGKTVANILKSMRKDVDVEATGAQISSISESRNGEILIKIKAKEMERTALEE